jgi:hypothetical protein
MAVPCSFELQYLGIRRPGFMSRTDVGWACSCVSSVVRGVDLTPGASHHAVNFASIDFDVAKHAVIQTAQFGGSTSCLQFGCEGQSQLCQQFGDTPDEPAQPRLCAGAIATHEDDVHRLGEERVQIFAPAQSCSVALPDPASRTTHRGGWNSRRAGRWHQAELMRPGRSCRRTCTCRAQCSDHLAKKDADRGADAHSRPLWLRCRRVSYFHAGAAAARRQRATSFSCMGCLPMGPLVGVIVRLQRAGLNVTSVQNPLTTLPESSRIGRARAGAHRTPNGSRRAFLCGDDRDRGR